MKIPVPIACSLESVELEDRRQEWIQLLNSDLIEGIRTESGVRLRLNSSPQILDSVNRLVAAEKQCCPWIKWSLDSTGAEAVLVASAETREGVESLVRLLSPTAPDRFRSIL